MLHIKGMTKRRIRKVAVSSFSILLFAKTFTLLLGFPPVSCQLEGPMTCSTIGGSCPAYLYYTLNNSDTLAYLANLFSVPQYALKQEDTNWNTGGIIVSVQCFCSESLTYTAEAAYRVRPGDTQDSIIAGDYESLASMITQNLVAGQLLQISLFCGCIDSLGQPLLTYMVQGADTLDRLATRFNTSMTTISSINNITEQDYQANEIIYIPIHDSALKPVVSLPFVSSDLAAVGGGIALGATVGIVLAALLLIAAIATLVFFLQKRKFCCYKNKLPSDGRTQGSIPRDAGASAGRSISQRRSWDIPGRVLQYCGPLDHVDTSLDEKHRCSSSFSLDIMTNGVFGAVKPIVFGYDEIAAATSNFKDSNQIGIGSHGAVYFGSLRDQVCAPHYYCPHPLQLLEVYRSHKLAIGAFAFLEAGNDGPNKQQEVAIKKMRATKTKQFLEELKIVCKMHHANLVELIGYSFREFDLFLVYEYAENRAVSDRLHSPRLKGFAPLTWNARVQIALDAARGLEYIHEHSKAHYVHRNVKTSNILLDGYFRAKVADFGLAKLVEQSQVDALPAMRPVGTFGYLAPECVRDGPATAKSDVYAFGVVLFELITAEGAILKSRTSGPDRRSLISIMLAALDNPSSNRAKLKAVIDPLLQDMYSFDSVLRMATLGQQCVEEDPQDRPHMRRIVLTLSQILLDCIEWETTLAGNTQVFSGLVQGR